MILPQGFDTEVISHIACQKAGAMVIYVTNSPLLKGKAEI